MSQIKAVLFDLDGTLLPMDQDEFTNGYFKLLTAKAAPRGYEPKALADAVWAGTAAMVKNTGVQTNEAAFWEMFSKTYGAEKTERDKPLFQDFYAVDFERARAFCPRNDKAAETVAKLQRLGYRVALATNPIFPRAATYSRIRWAGLVPEDFAFVTTYENSSYCKPNPDYYRDAAQRLGLSSGECLMVGNDVQEDMIAETVGMKVFLLTDCLINRNGADISVWPNGGFDELLRWIERERAKAPRG